MTTLDVAPHALVGAAAAVRSFARELEPVVVQDGALGDALDVFSTRWASTLGALADDAADTAASLQDAAAGYLSLDSLLVPRALR